MWLVISIMYIINASINALVYVTLNEAVRKELRGIAKWGHSHTQVIAIGSNQIMVQGVSK